MDQLLFVLTLLVALCTSSGGAEKCPASRANSVTFSVASRRNLTGHWIVSMDASREDPTLISEDTTTPGMSVEVGQKTTSCQASENLQLSAIATVSSGASKTPPADYEVINGLGYYKMHAVALTWTEARDKCVQEGAHLIILNSDQEAEVVRTYLERKPKVPNDDGPSNCYAGFHDRVKEGDYVTVLGKPLSSTGFTKWVIGQPDGKIAENCGTIMKTATEFGFFDVACSKRFFFVCEYSSV